MHMAVVLVIPTKVVVVVVALKALVKTVPELAGMAEIRKAGSQVVLLPEMRHIHHKAVVLVEIVHSLVAWAG